MFSQGKYLKKKYNLGLTTLEFSIAGGVLFMVIFMSLEVGRLMYSLILLDSYTRVAARLATVCPVDAAGQAAVKTDAQYVTLPGFTLDNIQLRYLNKDLIVLDPSIAEQFLKVRFVEASIANYQHPMIIPGFNITIDMPSFRTVIPSESLGEIPGMVSGTFTC